MHFKKFIIRNAYYNRYLGNKLNNINQYYTLKSSHTSNTTGYNKNILAFFYPSLFKPFSLFIQRPILYLSQSVCI